MTWGKTIYRLVFIIFFSIGFLGILGGCKDIVFNNPLDPDASQEVLQVVRVVQTSLSGRGDIAFDGEKFWKIDLLGNLDGFDRESGTIIRSFSATSGSGVTIWENNIYYCGGEGGNILYSLDPLSGEIINRVSTRELYPSLIAAFGDRFILYDTRSSGIFEYEPGTGRSVRLFELSGFSPGGLEGFRGGLLISDTSSDTIYHFSLSGEVLARYSSPAPGVSGVAVDYSDYVYLLMMDGNLYKVSIP